MKSKLIISFFLLPCVLVLVFFGCRKSNSNTNPAPSENGGLNDTVSTKSTGCTAPDYGDTLIYTKYKGPNNDYTISPKNITVSGKFIAWPNGLVIDSTTGTIDVTQSETGERYSIGFIKNGSTDTCISKLVLAGVTYLDGIYVLEKNDTLAKPYYNANPGTPPFCDNSDDTDYPGNSGGGNGNNRCQFDVDPPAGQKANDKGVRVRTISGIINLKKTVESGAFGPSPVNGASTTVQIQYRLNDASVKALQKINVQLYYYEKKSDVPLTLQNEITTRRNNFFNYVVVNGRPRPPQIVITHFAY